MKTKGIIAAGHKETARAGAEMLAAGGNAFDAALAATLASFVCEPSLTSLGGGGFLTAYTARGQQYLFDFFVQTPLVRHPVEEMEFLLSQINFGTTTQPQYIGRGSAAVPGCAAGVFAVHQKLGSMPIMEIAQPAIEMAKEGVLITPYQAYTISILEEVFQGDASCEEIFFPAGKLIQAGQRMVRPRLADTLFVLAKEGVRLFYEGEIAQLYAADSEAHGGSVSLADLKAYQVIERPPIQRPYHGHQFLSNPRPSAGGSMISYGLELLGRKQKLPEPEGPEYVRTLAEVMYGMEEMRKSHLLKGIDWMGNTTHISVLDEHGNAASVTTTLGGASGRTIPDTGILTNNMLGEMDLHPEGFYAWEPDTRVTSMMAPSILVKDGRARLVLGSGGSSRIRTAILQTLLHCVDHGMGVEAAVQYPRLHWENGILNLEPGLLNEELDPTDIPQAPTQKLIRWADKSMFFGGVHSVALGLDGNLHGMADPRRDGAIAEV